MLWRTWKVSWPIMASIMGFWTFTLYGMSALHARRTSLTDSSIGISRIHAPWYTRVVPKAFTSLSRSVSGIGKAVLIIRAPRPCHVVPDPRSVRLRTAARTFAESPLIKRQWRRRAIRPSVDMVAVVAREAPIRPTCMGGANRQHRRFLCSLLEA